MAQYIDTSLIGSDEFWDASSWRKMCREMAGIRGLAPAVHFRNSSNDDSESPVAPDDRIFRVHTHTRLYLWGVEMYAGSYDTLKIYWRSTAPDSNWSLDGGWTLIKGSGAFWKDDFNIDLNDVSTNQGTPEMALKGKVFGIHFPQSNPLPNGDYHSPGSPNYQDNTSFYNNWITELAHSGLMHGEMAGPYATVEDGNAYETRVSNFLRSFMLMKEGYWKFVLDESSSPWYNSSLGIPSNDNLDSSWFLSKGLMSPVSYSSNAKLYGSLSSHLEAEKNSYINSSGQLYRHGFYREINVQSFFPDKDLSSGETFARAFKTISSGSISVDTIIESPYTKVSAYGSEWGGSSVLSNPGSNSFIKIKNSIGIDVPGIYPYTESVKINERFSNFEWRYTPAFSKKTVNRRHLFVEGLNISGANGNINLWEKDAISSASVAPTYGFAGTEGLAKGWLIDFRGSVFKDCTFRNISIGCSFKSDWSGCSFINCKFYNCAVSTGGDSILFQECIFSGSAPENLDVFNPSSFSSSAIISSKFVNVDRPFIFTANKGPVCDNIIWRNVFENNSSQTGGSEFFVAELPIYLRSSAHSYCYSNSNNVNFDFISEQHEFSRNMFMYNVVYSSNRALVGPYSIFSRANFYFSNIFYDGIKISAYTSDSEKDKLLYDSWAHNVLHKLKVSLPERTYHFRLLLNSISMPQNFDDKNSLNQYDKFAGSENYWIASEDSVFESSWYCMNSTGMANKILKNTISNWGAYLSKHPQGPCSCFLNFHHVYDPDFNINSSSDSYWSSGDNWKYVNVVHRNMFEFPSLYKNTMYSDGQIGRLDIDQTAWSEINVNAAKIVMPLEFEIFGSNDPDMEQTSRGFICSQIQSDKDARDLCRAIYVKNQNNNTWELKNDGSIMWGSQIFRWPGSIP